MKKNLKRAALIAATGAMLIGTAFSAQAASKENGQWCQEADGWWYKLTEDGGKFLADTWYHIKDSDGVVRYYYFDQNGWLKTNATVDGYTLDENGRWVVNGQIQTAPESEDYATSVDFAQLKKAAASTNNNATTTTTTTTTTAAAAAKGKSTVTNNGKAWKTSGNGDSPSKATFTQGYGSSSINGSTITNDWANFQITLAGAKVAGEGDGTDIYIDSDTTSNIYFTFYPISKYGTASLDGFVSGFLADARGYKGGTKSDDIALGAYTFKQLTKTVKTPYGDLHDHAYIRAVDGTDYVLVITVEQNGNSEDYLSALKTMTKVR